ncbi:MAG: FG-GAP repeat protein, partial [Thermoanaerobaculales bacterium]|nr:FG-GAP repeat protein [Thermoanaerobaculales bacterium]
MNRAFLVSLLAWISVANGLPTRTVAAAGWHHGTPAATRSSTVTETDLVVPDDPSTYQSFGWAIAADGDTLVVGAPGDDDMGDNVGSVYIFQRAGESPGVWVLVTELYPPDPAVDDGFADAVAISGDTVVVAAVWADTTGVSGCGVVHLFERNQGGMDNWGHVRRVAADVPHDGDEFGSAVAIAGDLLVVGAVHGETDTVADCGVAYVFQRDWGGPASWGQVRRLQTADPTTGDDFACSVAIDGGTAVVGARYGDSDAVTDCGTATVFARDHGGSDTWGMVIELSSPTPTSDENFGDSLAIEGDTLIVTAPYETDAGTESGAAYVFGRNQGGADSWGVVARLTASDAAEYDNFGRSASLQS